MWLVQRRDIFLRYERCTACSVLDICFLTIGLSILTGIVLADADNRYSAGRAFQLYLAFIFKAGVRIGAFGNLMSCLAGIVSPLTAALAVRTGIFGPVFSFCFVMETALAVGAFGLFLLISNSKGPEGDDRKARLSSLCAEALKKARLISQHY